MNLLLLEPEELDAEGRVTLQGRRARHLSSVLKVRPGSELRAGLLEGPLGRAVVEELLAPPGAPKAVRVRFHPEGPTPPRPRVDLLLAVPRPKALKRLYAPLAALGLGRLILFNAAKVEPSYFDSHALEPSLARESFLLGLEQAMDTRPPELGIRRSFKAAVAELDALFGPPGEGAHRLLADPLFSASPRAACAALRDRALEAGEEARVVLAVGPEGGFTPYEREQLLAAGFAGVGLGPRVLRAETASICLLTLVHDGLRPDRLEG